MEFKNQQPISNRAFRKAGRGFSLVEMLVVVAVIGMLLALSAPSILTLTSTSLTTGAWQLNGYLNLARAEAIRDGRVVRVALVRNWDNEQHSALRKLSTWKWDDEAEVFVQSGGWEILPEGVVIEPEFPDYVRSADYAKDDATTVQAQFPERDETLSISGDTVEVTTLDFLPNGRVRESGEIPKRMIGFVMTLGYVDEQGNVVRTASRDDSGQPANWAQVNVDTLTGRIQVHRP